MDMVWRLACRTFLLLMLIVGMQVYAGEISETDQGVAIMGFDPTSYFIEGKPKKGNTNHQYKWKGSTWYFATEKNRELFEKNPEKYAPQFGGFCANGLSDGHKIEADPRIWRLIDGKLYMYFSQYGRNQWSDDVAGHIERATETWREVKTD